MEIIKVTPQGFCKGVIAAIALINKALKNDNIKPPIYMLGGLVHNKHIINAYERKGVKIISSLDNIYEGTVIITAHGVSDKVIETIKARNLGLINATCFDVTKTHNIIKAKLSEGYDIIFYGKATHPETKGVLGISNQIHLIEKQDDIYKLNLNSQKIIFATQTTMSYLDVLEIKKLVQAKYPQVEAYEEVCTATKLRQTALIEQAKTADLCIVVGDPTSNNTNKLKEVCTRYTNTPCIMIENINNLKDFNFNGINKIVITSGASTPPAIVSEVISGIRNYDFESKLQDDDYLKFK